MVAHCPALGHVAVKHKFITKTQLEKALADIITENKAGRPISLEDHLIKIGLIDKITMSKLIAATIRQLDKQFGAIAVANGFAKQEDVDKALGLQKRKFVDKELLLIGDILIDSGSLTQDQRDLILQEQNEITCQSDDKNSEEPPLQPNDVPKSQEQQPEEESKKLEAELITSLPHLKAEIVIPESCLEKIDLLEIQKIIRNKGIKNGIVNDSIIENKLNTNVPGTLRFTVAEGTPPTPGKHAEIKLYFQKEYLNPGTITDDGTIDFRDRGSIPFVKNGELLAEKIPAEEGMPGSTIFGDTIPIETPNDISLRSETGTEASKDGLKIYATTDGQPIISVHGEVSVFTEHKIAGDVDYNTGNIQFNGNIIVNGTIKEGFTVKGGSLTAREIVGASIDVIGNVDVSGGIINSEISAGGSVQAMYMTDSKTDSYGDIKIKKEIIDCSISTSGACTGERTKIITSVISASQGIEAARIGTDISKPCVLKVGTNDHTEKQIQIIQERFENKKIRLAEQQKKIEALKNNQSNFLKKFTELNTKSDLISEKKTLIQEKLNQYKKTALSDGDKNNLTRMETAVSELDKALAQIKEEASGCFEEQELLTDEIETYSNYFEALIGEIETLNINIRDIRSWAKKNKTVPRVKTLKEIYSKTSITGTNSAIILEENIKNSSVKEMKRVDDDHSGWEMKIISNKK